MLNSKLPRIFAESEIEGDGSDWTMEELQILGDIGVAVPVTIFDNGKHTDPDVHDPPLDGTLLFVPGALLRARRGRTPVDRHVVKDGEIDLERYTALYERRLVPLLRYASDQAQRQGREAVVTVPGLGCGQFAGTFRGTVGRYLGAAIGEILRRNAELLAGIRMVWFDPYRECHNEQTDIGHISYRIRPLLQNDPPKPQLCRPEAFEEEGDDFGACMLFSFVAWDHVSWPGNDFYGGARATDDGVKAAATDSMYALTGVAGQYDPVATMYKPPADMHLWEFVVLDHKLRLIAQDNCITY
jgi:hypothetical protein